MPRHRYRTPAARLRDARAAAARRVGLELGLGLGVCALVCLATLAGLVATATGATGPRPQASAAHAVAAPDSAPDPAASTVPRPDGHVWDTAPRAHPVPPGWSEIEPLLTAAVAEAGLAGHSMAACVLSIDSPDEREVCAGDDQTRYAASAIKLAFAVAALEAWDGDARAETPYGTLDDLLDLAISVSDNEAANLLYDLAVVGPSAPPGADPSEPAGPVPVINAVTDRVALAEDFHTGGAFRWEWTGDWSRVSAHGSVRYLDELVRAADGRAPRDRALTSPAIARIVLDKMSAQERRWKLPGELPEGSTANKTGETDAESHDLAVVNTTTGRYAISVVSATSGYDTPDAIMTALGRDVVGALGGAVRF